MRVSLDSALIDDIKNYVDIYTTESGEAISQPMVLMIIDMLVQKYVAVRSYPTYWTDVQIRDDVTNYFESHLPQIALKIPEIVGRMGAEGETSHSENSISRTYAHGDVLYDALPDAVQIAHVF